MPTQEARIKRNFSHSSPRQGSHKHQKGRLPKLSFLVGSVLVVFQLILAVQVKYALVGTSSQLSVPGPNSLQANSVVHVAEASIGTPDGTFNDYPVYYKNVSAIAYTKPVSIQHCIGENYQKETNWKQRSCHFKFMCFNMTSRQFQVYQRPRDQRFRSGAVLTKNFDVSQSVIHPNTTVSIGGINPKWGRHGVPRLEWFPTIMSDPPAEFYALPESVVMVPFHSLAGWNPGHAVWDDFLPIFTLAYLFQFHTSDYELLPLRMILEGEKLWASCDFDARSEECNRMLRKFWPLLNNYSTPAEQPTVELKLRSGLQPRTELVCAKNALAGVGALTDHGWEKLHGWHEEDYKTTHNHGRGGVIWKFRSFCMQHLGISPFTLTTPKAPFNIVFSVGSSSVEARKLDFALHESLLQRKFKPEQATVRSVTLKDLTLRDQVQLASETTIFVTGCGGGAVTATFLPRGSTLIIYYPATGGRKHNAPTNSPARLDWDLFNHMSHIRVLWLPAETMEDRQDMEDFYHLVREDLSRRQHVLDTDTT
eukprot:Nitzschia sp. Nitz4//scaffold69_size99277//72167//73774//NITZ4_004643-RA/size99277-processed-gene-0.25-mRNA-1//1//CDS//3329556745//3560//frame0